jgi:hypothetical protein
MPRRNRTAKQEAAAPLEKLRPAEAAIVLTQLLDKHPELKSEAKELATQMMSAASMEEVAEEVYLEITSVDLEALNGRAGSHSWGYVEPSEAAMELLTEAVEARVEEMKRSLELGLLAPAEALCAGIVEGLYRARDARSDGALGWAPDFPAEEAGFVVEEFLKGCRPASRKAAQANLMKVLTTLTPEWFAALQRVAEQAFGDKAGPGA